MKKAAIYIAIGILAAWAIVYWLEYRKRKQPSKLRIGGIPVYTPEAIAPKKYENLNYNMILVDGKTGDEVEVLQRFINAYNGNTNLAITGVFNDATGDALKAIKGNGSTTLFDFRYNWMGKAGNDRLLADKIINGEL